MKFSRNLLFFFVLALLFSCGTDETVDPVDMEPPVKKTSFGSFEVQEDNTVNLSGLITESTAENLEELIEEYPATTQIIMGNVDGATSHEAAFSAARIVRNNQLDIHIADDKTIRKEAVNFLLGGIKRSKGNAVQIGVSAWSNDLGQEATDFDFGHEAHLPWINFYVEMEYQYQLATDFYNFSIFAAEADDIYFLTDDQLNTYDIIN